MPHHGVQIVQHLPRRNPQRPVPLLRNPFIPPLVASRIGPPIVRLPIHLDRKFRFETGKIQRERPRRMLLAEPEPELLPAQLAPQQALGQGQLPP
jgi:hypothetical protein